MHRRSEFCSQKYDSDYLFTGLVTPTSVSVFRLLFMHNLKRPFFAQYDMPERYDLARKTYFASKNSRLLIDLFDIP